MKIKNVIGYEGIYAVTDSGEVYNLNTGLKLKGYIRGGYDIKKLSKNGNQEHIRTHRIVYEAFKGRIIPNLVIDHIDENKLNNALSNLRQITTRQNITRSRKNKYGTGVSFLKPIQKYKAELTIDGVKYYLGVFEDIEGARNAYEDALYKWETTQVKPFKRDRTKKYCVKCDATKNVDEFYHVKSHGYSHLCKECHKKTMKDYR